MSFLLWLIIFGRVLKNGLLKYSLFSLSYIILLSWLLVFYNHLFQVKGQKMYNRQGPNKKNNESKKRDRKWKEDGEDYN